MHIFPLTALGHSDHFQDNPGFFQQNLFSYKPVRKLPSFRYTISNYFALPKGEEVPLNRSLCL